ncbi:hypothetical protein Tco_1165082 [Tanacetum coccineum]
MQTSSEVANPRASLAQVETHSRRPEKVMWYFTFGRQLGRISRELGLIGEENGKDTVSPTLTQDNVLQQLETASPIQREPSQRIPRWRYRLSQDQ